MGVSHPKKGRPPHMSAHDVSWALNYQDLPSGCSIGRPSNVKLVFLTLVYLADPDAPFPTLDAITSASHLSRHVVRRAIRALRDYGVPEVLVERGVCGREFASGWTTAARWPATKQLAPRQRTPNRPGEVVYLVGSRDCSLVKIGWTTGLTKRLRDIQSMSPLPLTVLWTTPGSRETEARLHAAFAAYRAHGEWFDFGTADPIELIDTEMADVAGGAI